MVLLLCSIYSAFGAKLSGCGPLELGGRGCFDLILIVLLGAWVSDESVWGGEVSWTVAKKLEVPPAEITLSGALSILPLLPVARSIDASREPRVVVVCRVRCGGLGGGSKLRTYEAKRRVKFLPAAGAHSIDQHS